MKNKVLTVSVAAYNVEKYIRDTLESLIVPDILEDIEVLVINDGSTDATPLIADEYVKKYPDTFSLINKENGGYGSTINMAVKHASGKYFKQLDGDDWFDKENLIEFVRFLSTSDAECVYSPYWEVYQDNRESNLKKLIYRSGKPLGVNDIGMWALAFKTKIFKDNYITITENCFYTDTEYNLKPLFFTNSIDYFDKTIYCYRLGRKGQSVGKDGWRNHYREYNNVALEMMSYYEQHKNSAAAFDKEVIREYISNVYKTNFYIALELSEPAIFEDYMQLDVTVKNKFSLFYKRRNLKMVVLTKSRYKLWGIIQRYHRLFEKACL